MTAERAANPEPDRRAPSRRASRWTVVAFGVAIWLPLLVGLVERDEAVSTTENRFLATLPEIEPSWQSVASFPKRMEAYYDDRLGLRNSLIRGYSYLKIELFGVSPSDSLIVGKQGWLFFGDRDAIAHYRGLAPLSAGKLNRWRRVLEKRRNWLAERDIEFLLVLVPDKHSMYSEYMPDRLPRAGPLHPLDQLSRHLAATSDLNVLDLRAPLEQAKKIRRTHHRTDSHWNEVGAYAAYRAILARLGEILPEMAGATPVAVEPHSIDSPGLGLASIVGLSRIYREELLEMTPLRRRSAVKPEHRATYAERVRKLLPIALGVEDRSLPRAVMFRDSFANALIPYLSENFYRILYVWDRDVDSRIVSVEKPDVVILEIVGRFLGKPPTANHRGGDPAAR